MQEPRDDELLIGPELPQNPRGFAGVAIIGPSRAEISDGLLDPVQHR
jgi:hypothetical protein